MLSKVAKFIRELNSTVISIISIFGLVGAFLIYFRDSVLDFLLRDVELPIGFFIAVFLLLTYILYWIIRNRPEKEYKPIAVYEEVMGLKWRIMENPKYWIDGDASKFSKEYCDSILADPDCPQCGSQIIGKWHDRIKYTDIWCAHCEYESDFRIDKNRIREIPTYEAKFMVIQGLQRHCRNKGKFQIINNEKFQFTLNQLSRKPRQYSNSETQ